VAAVGGCLLKFVEHGLQTLLCLDGVGVVGAEPGPEDGQGAFQGGSSGWQVAKAAQHVPEVGEVTGGVRVVGAEAGLVDV
jgi:hypothetical protein